MTHSDILKGFDMVAAISQNTVNYQFSQLFNQGIIHNALDIQMADTGLELKANLSAPTVSFSVAGQLRKVLFMLNMPSGTFSYYEGFGPSAKQKSVNFTNWRYAFQVNLDMQGISQDAIKAHASIPPVVKQTLEQFNDSMFSIQNLFMDFQNADLASYDPNYTSMKFPDGSNLTPGQMTQFQNAIENFFKSLTGSNNPYILGYTINTNNPNADPSTVPTFVPTGATFSTFDDATNEGLNALNFLVMTNHHNLPTDPSAGIFASNWIDSNDYDGRFIIAEHLFMDQWLLPILTNSLNIGQPTPTDSGWSFSQSATNSYTINDGVNCISSLTKVDAHIEDSYNYSATVTYVNKTSSEVDIVMSGTFQRTYKNSFQCIFDEWMSETAIINWTGTIAISTGNDGQLSLQLTMDVPDAQKSTDGNWLGKGDIALIPDNQKILDGIGSSFETAIKNQLGNLSSFLGNLHNKFILPAGDIFFFKNLQMDSYGNLLMEITYKSLH